MKVDFSTFIEVGQLFQALRDNAEDRAKYDASMGMQTEQILADALKAAEQRGYDLAIEKLRSRLRAGPAKSFDMPDWLDTNRPDVVKSN